MHDQAVAVAVADDFLKNGTTLFEAAVDVRAGISFCHGFELPVRSETSHMPG